MNRMFIGHFAVAFAAKRAAPRVSLGTLFAATSLADLLWPVLVAIGVEQVRIDPGNTAVTPLDFVSYPWSHSLLLLVLWACLFGLVHRLLMRRNGAAILLAVVVVSHWVLDYVTHRPDMPLYPGGPKYGLGLWNSVAATMIVEVAMFAGALWLYLRATRPVGWPGGWGFGSLLVVLLAAYGGNLFGRPPPSVQALTGVALVGGLLSIAWAAWADRYRRVTR